MLEWRCSIMDVRRFCKPMGGASIAPTAYKKMIKMKKYAGKWIEMVLNGAKGEEEKWTGPPCSAGCVFHAGSVSFELIRNFVSGHDLTGIIQVVWILI